MRRNSWPVFTCALGLALAVNFILFALIPHLARTDIPRLVPFRRQPIHFFKEVPPEPEVVKTVEEVVEKEIPPPTPEPQLPQPRLPRMIQDPALEDSALPQPTLPMAAGLTAAPLTNLADIYRPEDLDRAPRVSYQVPPLYPYRAKRMNISGHVRIRFDVNAEGGVENISIIESEPPGVFDEAVLSAVSQWRFHPGELLGDRIVTRMTRNIVFNLED
jgi:protein TonB